MPAAPISMRKLKEILRLKYGCALSHRQIAKSLSTSASVVSHCAHRAAQLGITRWPLAPEWDDAHLQRAFMQTRVKKRTEVVIDWGKIHQQLKHKSVTLQLLWEEYLESNPVCHYSYTHFCRLYKEWKQRQSPSRRQHHQAKVIYRLLWFYSLQALNQRIRSLLTQLNKNPLKKLPGSRLSQFQQIDQPALKPRPTLPYCYTQVKQARGQLDYHVEIDKHYYAVPHRLLKKS